MCFRRFSVDCNCFCCCLSHIPHTHIWADDLVQRFFFHFSFFRPWKSLYKKQFQFIQQAWSQRPTSSFALNRLIACFGAVNVCMIFFFFFAIPPNMLRYAGVLCLLLNSCFFLLSLCIGNVPFRAMRKKKKPWTLNVILGIRRLMFDGVLCWVFKIYKNNHQNTRAYYAFSVENAFN